MNSGFAFSRLWLPMLNLHARSTASSLFVTIGFPVFFGCFSKPSSAISPRFRAYYIRFRQYWHPKCVTLTLQDDTSCDGLLTDSEESLSMAHSDLTTSYIESSVARAFSALLKKPSEPSTVRQASRAIRDDWRFSQQNTDKIA